MRVKKSAFEDDKDIAVNGILRALFKGEDRKLDATLLIEDLNKEIDKLKYFKEDIALLLSIIKELNRRLNAILQLLNSTQE